MYHRAARFGFRYVFGEPLNQSDHERLGRRDALAVLPRPPGQLPRAVVVRLAETFQARFTRVHSVQRPESRGHGVVHRGSVVRAR